MEGVFLGGDDWFPAFDLIERSCTECKVIGYPLPVYRSLGIPI